MTKIGASSSVNQGASGRFHRGAKRVHQAPAKGENINEKRKKIREIKDLSSRKPLRRTICQARKAPEA